MTTLLDEDLSDVLDEVIPYTARLGRNVFTGGGLFAVLNSIRQGHLWIMTYTATNAVELKLPVKRLLLCRGEYGVAHVTKKASNIHSKIYIVRRNQQTVSAFVGSQNLVAPSQENLMVCVTAPDDLRYITTYYNFFWNQL